MSSIKKLELSPSISIIIAGIIIAGAIVYVNSHPNTQAAPSGGQQQVAAPVSVRPPQANDHIIGSPTAPIVLIEYSDFQCPFCSMIYPTLKKLVTESNGQIAWIYREFPLTSIHPNANPAANAAECIAEQLGNDGFWKFADAVFADQSKLSSSFYTSEAKALGADPTKFAACMSASKYQGRIDADSSEAQAAGGNGTPFTVVFNTKNGKGEPVSGALPYAQFVSVIKSAQQ